MDVEVTWSPEAVEDLESITEYIARDSEYYARAVVSSILSTTRSIAEHPYLGRVVPEMRNDRIRERFVYSYRLVYRIEPERVLVVPVMHGKRLLENISERMDST